MLVSALSLSVTLLAYIFLHSELMNKTPGRVCTFKESQQQMIEFLGNFSLICTPYLMLQGVTYFAWHRLWWWLTWHWLPSVSVADLTPGLSGRAFQLVFSMHFPGSTKCQWLSYFSRFFSFFLQRYSCTFLSWQPLLGWLLIAGTFSFASGKSLSEWLSYILYRIFTRVPLLLLLKNMK